MWWKLTVRDYETTFPGCEWKEITTQTEKINGTKKLKSVIKAIARNEFRINNPINTRIEIENCITGLKKEVNLWFEKDKIINHPNLIDYISNNE